MPEGGLHPVRDGCYYLAEATAAELAELRRSLRFPSSDRAMKDHGRPQALVRVPSPPLAHPTFVFVPSGAPIRPLGQVIPASLPAVELATTVHAGSHGDIDRAYGSLVHVSLGARAGSRWPSTRALPRRTPRNIRRGVVANSDRLDHLRHQTAGLGTLQMFRGQHLSSPFCNRSIGLELRFRQPHD
jgi:hypothetical protein